MPLEYPATLVRTITKASLDLAGGGAVTLTVARQIDGVTIGEDQYTLTAQQVAGYWQAQPVGGKTRWADLRDTAFAMLIETGKIPAVE